MQAEIIKTIAAPPSQLLFDWQLDVSRLEKEAFDATQRETADPWALAEAECSLDLIGAEIAAVRANAPGEARRKTLAHLEAWRLRLERVIRNLGALSMEGRKTGGAARTGGEPFDSQKLTAS